MKRVMLSGVLAVMLAVSARSALAAKCGANAGDEAAVISARATAAMDCDCATATNHGAYVKCVAGVANMLSSGNNPSLPQSCKGAVKKCAAHSACGKPGAVTCCLTSSKGTKCKIAKSTDACTKKGGHATVDPSNTSCCSNTHPLADNACMASPSGAFLDSEQAPF